ncbi:MAG: hypothetical protein ACPGRW_06360 [Flavobacteriaceae bacterium]
MFNSSVVTEYQNLLGWRQYRDTTQIDLPVELTTSETSEYFQQKHPALRLDIIQSMLPEDMPLVTYLREVVTESTVEIFNDFIRSRQAEGYGKTLLDNKVLLNRYGFARDAIVNQNRFVGFQIRLRTLEGLTLLLNQIGLQFSGANNFNLYLFHDSKVDPIATIPVVTDTNGGWQWQNVNQVLHAFNEANYVGGVFVLGYYQEDLTGSAINYSNFNWDRGECGSCNSQYGNEWREMGKYYHFFPLYVPSGSYTRGKMFDLRDCFYDNAHSWGLNFRMSVRCDLTQFFKENKFAFKNLLALKVVYKVLNMMKFSQETNYIEENIKNMIIRDLEGDKETNLLNIPIQYSRELNSVKFNTSMMNKLCFTCKQLRHGVKYSNI